MCDYRGNVENTLTEMEETIEGIKMFGLTKRGVEILEGCCREWKDFEKNTFMFEKGIEDEEEVVIVGPPNIFEFRCTTCLIIKDIDLREEKGKQKSSVCKQCANNKLKEYRNKSKENGISRYECVCGSILQRWGLARHEQTTKLKMFMDTHFGQTNEPLDGMGTNDPLIEF